MDGSGFSNWPVWDPTVLDVWRYGLLNMTNYRIEDLLLDERGVLVQTALQRVVNQIGRASLRKFGLYQKAGYGMVGVVPDANGFGKPGIMMAKRVGDVQNRRQGSY